MVGGNPFNHLGDFLERPYFLKVNHTKSLYFFLHSSPPLSTHLESGGEKWRRSMYFACDFNGSWLKDSNFLCCVDVLLSVEGRVV
jgi:hypothetical protein